MARLIFLHAGPIGLIAQRQGKAEGDRCKAWFERLELGGVLVFCPEIAVYEVRRELLRINASAAIRRLNSVISRTVYVPIRTDAMERAAGFWAELRRSGIPTASPDSLDADCILAAQAVQVAGPGDTVAVATTNLVHLARFPGLDARFWDTIT